MITVRNRAVRALMAAAGVALGASACAQPASTSSRAAATTPSPSPSCLYANAWLTQVDPAVAKAACTDPAWVTKAKTLVSMYYPATAIPSPQLPDGYGSAQEQSILAATPSPPAPGPDDGTIMAYPLAGADQLPVVPTTEYQKTTGYYTTRVFAGVSLTYSAAGAATADPSQAAIGIKVTAYDGAPGNPPYADGKVILVPNASGALFVTKAALPVVTVVDVTKHVFTVDIATGVVTAAGSVAVLPAAAWPPKPAVASPQPGVPTISLSSLSAAVGSSITATVSNCPPLATGPATGGLSPFIFVDSATAASHHETAPIVVALARTSDSSMTAQWTISSSTTLGYGEFIAHCGDGSAAAIQDFAVTP